MNYCLIDSDSNYHLLPSDQRSFNNNLKALSSGTQSLFFCSHRLTFDKVSCDPKLKVRWRLTTWTFRTADRSFILGCVDLHWLNPSLSKERPSHSVQPTWFWRGSRTKHHDNTRQTPRQRPCFFYGTLVGLNSFFYLSILKR